MSVRPIGPGMRTNLVAVLAAVAAAALVTATVTGFAWAPRGVTIVVDGVRSTHATRATTVGELLAEHRVPVALGDLVSPPPSEALPTGGIVVVRHAVPVALRVGTRRMRLRVVGSTVADVLVAAGLDPTTGYRVEPALTGPLRSGMSITALESWVSTWKAEYRVPFRTLVHADNDLPEGTRLVRQPGRAGVGVKTLRAVVTLGRKGPASVMADKVSLAPIDRIVDVGVKHADRPAVVTQASYRTVKAASVPAAPDAGQKLTVVATAYSPNHGCGTRTATGLTAAYGIIAVDPRVIPLGTRLYVPGYGYGLAADTGGAIKGKRIDVCYDHEWQCDDWGRKTVTVIIVK